MHAVRRLAWSDHLHGPALDGVLLLGVPALALGLGGAVVAVPSLFAPVLLFDVWALAYPHVSSTYTRIAFDRVSARRHWFLLTLLPLLTLAATALVGARWGVGGLFTAYYVGQAYHATRQSYGLARAYRWRAPGADPLTTRLADAVIYAFPAWGLLHRASQGHTTFYDAPLLLPRVPSVFASVAGVASVALFAAWLAREGRALAAGSGRLGHALLVLTHALVSAAGYLMVTDITAGWLIVNLWHNAQYLVFVWVYHRQKLRGGHRPEQALLAWLTRPRHLWAYALVCVALGAGVHLLVDQSRRWATTTLLPLTLVLHLTINFHHYLVDGVVWARRAV